MFVKGTKKYFLKHPRNFMGVKIKLNNNPAIQKINS